MSKKQERIKSIKDLLNQDMGSTADWLEANQHNYVLLDVNLAKNQEEVFNFIQSWKSNIPEIIESSSGLCLEFFDSLSDILSDQEQNY